MLQKKMEVGGKSNWNQVQLTVSIIFLSIKFNRLMTERIISNRDRICHSPVI
jgi:hypothetical protein